MSDQKTSTNKWRCAPRDNTLYLLMDNRLPKVLFLLAQSIVCFSVYFGVVCIILFLQRAVSCCLNSLNLTNDPLNHALQGNVRLENRKTSSPYFLPQITQFSSLILILYPEFLTSCFLFLTLSFLFLSPYPLHLIPYSISLNPSLSFLIPYSSVLIPYS